MKTYILNNGVIMPSFGLGTFLVEQGESAYEIVKSALKIGYRHIDTAQAYGNEADVGRAIKDSKIPRKDIFVTSKLSRKYFGDEKVIRAALDESLKVLDLDYIDLMLIHWPSHDIEQNRLIWSIFEEYYMAGKFKAIGVSNFQRHHMEDLLKTAKVRPVVNQVECHPLLSQQPLHKYLETIDCQMTSYGPFAKGEIFKGRPYEILLEVAKKYGATIPQVVIAWGLERQIVMIPKSVHEDRLLENFKGQELVLSKEDLEKVNSINRGRRLYTDPDNTPDTW
ncbi:aldo/keto reductase [Acholeplasma granularum]|uniref:aldo/keto reductase n=1 Tax=Acholeplasma granularum TaxID=264635 RepID=UPI00046F04E5|nr:aldo/keto reductase [Acholeplasma granularum]